MRRGGRLLLATTVLAVAACAADSGELQVRATALPPSAVAKPIPIRIAEAQGQLALGNVALALESFRKALREDPASVEAMAGIAACYDRMGRFDLSRRHYEAALAAAPGDPQLLAAFASSLELQGLRAEATRVRGEIAARLAAAETPAPAPAPSLPIEAAADPVPELAESASPIAAAEAEAAVALPVAAAAASQPVAIGESAPLVGKSVTVSLPPAKPVRQAAAAPAPVRHAGAAKRRSPRLERLTTGEVALVTVGQPLWKPQLLHRDARSETVRWMPLRQAQAPAPNGIRLLNAARSEGLAARTRAYLVQRGWSTMAIGDAPETLARSVVFYPQSRRRIGLSLAAQFGFEAVPRADGREITVLLGRDAAAHSALQADG